VVSHPTLPSNLRASSMWANLAIVDHPCGFGWVDSSMCISEPSKKKSTTTE
jgi:hypothetical protein